MPEIVFVTLGLPRFLQPIGVSLSRVSDFLIVRVRARSVDVGGCSDDEREHICHHADWY